MSKEIELARANTGDAVQVFMLQPGKTNITTGTLTGVTLVHCVVAGDITVTYADTTEETISLEDGDQFCFEGGAATVEVVSGKIHYMS